MPEQDRLETLRSVNVKMTGAMISKLRKNDVNRSRMVRRIISAILHEREKGNDAPFDYAVQAASRSSAKTCKMIQADAIDWRKAIVWIPSALHDEIVAVLRGHDLRPADFIRGAAIGYTGEDPTAELVTTGQELWRGEIEEDRAAGESD